MAYTIGVIAGIIITIITVLAAIGGLNIVISLGSIIRGDMIEGGAISGTFVNLMCGVMMIVIIVAIGIKDAIDKKNERENG